MIYAQGVLFFAAGFETTSNALATLTYNLARHPDIQVNLDFVLTLTLIYLRMWDEKLKYLFVLTFVLFQQEQVYQEIQEVTSANNGQINFETISQVQRFGMPVWDFI